MSSETVVHLLRHGEVYNPDGILYGRIPGFGLSTRGHAMAQRVADHLVARGNDITVLKASSLQRAQETARPISEALGLPVATDDRVIEAANHFEGTTFGSGQGSPWNPRNWPYLWNPLRPSWGEPYRDQVQRMMHAIAQAAVDAEGHEALIVSHQLPIWLTRSQIEGRPLAHDPRKRECTLASLTSIHIRDGQITGLTYTEPARDLLPTKPGVPGA